MKSKIYFAGLVAACCVFTWVGCTKNSSPTSSPDSAIIGTWSGLAISAGGISHDTNSIELTFTKTGYMMLRGMVTHASSGDAMLDSAGETGTYTETGTNLTLHSTACKMRASWETSMSTVDCSAPVTIQVAISNNAWTITMIEWKNGYSITYPMYKR